MSAPAQNCTTVATTRIAGISQSIVSRYSGTYISTIRPRPTARVTCHLRFSAVRCVVAGPVAGPALRRRCRAGVGALAARRWRCSRRGRRRRSARRAPTVPRVEADGGDLGGQVDLGGADAVDPVAGPSRPGRRRRRRSCRRCRGCSCASVAARWPGGGGWWSWWAPESGELQCELHRGASAASRPVKSPVAQRSGRVARSA